MKQASSLLKLPLEGKTIATLRKFCRTSFRFRDSGFSRDVQRFLEEVGTDGKEARYWLKIFQHRDANPMQPFAILQVCNSVFKRPHMLNKLGSSLAFLQKNGLTTLVIHGLNGDGRLIGPDERSQLLEQTIQLSDVIEKQGAKTRPMVNVSGAIRTTGLESNPKLQLNTELLNWSLSSGSIPILTSLAETADGQIVHVCPVRAADEFAAVYQPSKMMYLNNTGGLTNVNGKMISQICFPDDLNDQFKSRLTNENVTQLEAIAALMEKLPFTSSVVVTSADAVLSELFTYRGSGTLFNKREKLIIHNDLDDLDLKKIMDLIESTFGKKLKETYRKTISKKLHTAYVTQSYSAIAIITNEKDVYEVPYLDKFAINKQHQGYGAGETLWERITHDFPSLFWRSKGDNRINPWYFQRSEGSWTNGNYTIFWYGLRDPKLSHKIIDFSLQSPTSFVKAD